MGNGKHRWKIAFHRSASTIMFNFQKQRPPKEFVCPISGSLMADPVVVSSGHTFERCCIQACIALSFKPLLSDRSTPDFSNIIPNLALKSAILNWCLSSLIDPPVPVDFQSALKLVRTLIASQKPESHQIQKQIKEDVELLDGAGEMNNVATPIKFCSHADAELAGRPINFSSSSEESVTAITPLPLTTRLSYHSSSSSSDVEALSPNSTEEDEHITRLRSSQVFEQEEAAISLRKLTRTREDIRARLCNSRLLSALRSLISSRYASIQVNSVAALVNLSLENQNKVTIVRSGIVPPLIDVLRGGSPEAQDHAAGALFSLALDDQNKTAIGVLGALPPLLHALRSGSDRCRHDSALALYHLSLVQSNRAKLVKLGSVPVLLGMAKSGHMTGRVLMVLCNLAVSGEGRAAMLDGGAVECLVGMLGQDEFDSESAREGCVTALDRLSQGGLRFKGLAKEAGAEEILRKAEITASERTREKVRRISEVLTRKEEEEEEEEVVDWEALLNSGEVSPTLSRLSGGINSNST